MNSPEELKALLSTPLALFVLMLFASLGSAFKQMAVARRGGGGVSASSYFLDHWPETLIMIGGNITAFLGLIFTDTLNPAAALGFGYMANDAADAWTKQGRSAAIGVGDRQGGWARVSLLVLLAGLTSLVLAACVTTPGGGRELSTTGKIALQEVSAIAVRRFVADSPRAVEKVRNIRQVALRLEAVSSIASVSELRQVVEAEVERLSLTPVDRADATSLLNIFEALLREQLGRDELDSDALVHVNEFITMIVAALPPV